MDIKQEITDYSLRHYKLVTVVIVAFTKSCGRNRWRPTR